MPGTPPRVCTGSIGRVTRVLTNRGQQTRAQGPIRAATGRATGTEVPRAGGAGRPDGAPMEAAAADALVLAVVRALDNPIEDSADRLRMRSVRRSSRGDSTRVPTPPQPVCRGLEAGTHRTRDPPNRGDETPCPGGDIDCTLPRRRSTPPRLGALRTRDGIEPEDATPAGRGHDQEACVEAREWHRHTADEHDRHHGDLGHPAPARHLPLAVRAHTHDDGERPTAVRPVETQRTEHPPLQVGGHFRFRSLLSDSNRRPAAYKAAALAS